MRFPIAVAAVSLLAALGCAGGGGPPPSASEAEAETRQASPPCMGSTDGECPSGDPMQDF